MAKPLPYGRHRINKQDIDAAIDVLKSDWLTQGPKIPEFEAALCDYCGTDFASAMNSATSALHVSCLALGVSSGDLVWTSPISFVASANCARLCGADVDFVDVDPETGNICLKALTQKLKIAASLGRVPKVLIVVHLAGISAAMREIRELVRPYGIKIIEDASHGLGGLYENEKIGSCRFSEITVFSFHPVKPITCCEGGVAMTNCEKLKSLLDQFRTHGVVRNLISSENASVKPWHYEQTALGLNYRLSDLHAALGISQLSFLDNYRLLKDVLANKYKEKLCHFNIGLPKEPKGCVSAHHLFVVRLKGSVGPEVRDELILEMSNLGVTCSMHYMPIYRHPYYRQFNYEVTDYPGAEQYYREAFSLPLYPDLSDENLDYIVSSLKTSLKQMRLFG